MLKSGSLDIAVPNNTHLMALLHVAHNQIYHPRQPGFLYLYKMLKFKLKLGYFAWCNRSSIGQMMR